MDLEQGCGCKYILLVERFSSPPSHQAVFAFGHVCINGVLKLSCSGYFSNKTRIKSTESAALRRHSLHHDISKVRYDQGPL